METLQQQFSNQKAFRRTIMRRVWYVYAVSFFVRRSFAAGFVFGASAIALWRLVSITSIIENFLATEVGQVPTYIWVSLTQTDIATLLAFVVLTLMVGKGVFKMATSLSIAKPHVFQ